MDELRLKILNDCLDAIRVANDTLQEVRDEEEDAYDNLPESMQDGERGDLMSEAIDNLDDAICSLDDAITSMEEVTENGQDPLAKDFNPWEMLKIGDVVTHKSLGRGSISAIDGDHFTIAFASRSARFIFPDAIEKGFITI